ncbi:hypothetical protein BKA93DRAFT_747233 [Sparassis latifolia]
MLHNDHSQIPVLRQGLDVSAFYNTWRVFMEWSEITRIDHLSVPCIRGTIRHDTSNPRLIMRTHRHPSRISLSMLLPQNFEKSAANMSDKVSVSPVQCPKSSTETDVASTSRPPSSDTRTSLLEEIEDLKREQQKLMQLILILEKEVKTMELRVEQSEQCAVHVREFAEATADLAALVPELLAGGIGFAVCVMYLAQY